MRIDESLRPSCYVEYYRSDACSSWGAVGEGELNWWTPCVVLCGGYEGTSRCAMIGHPKYPVPCSDVIQTILYQPLRDVSSLHQNRIDLDFAP